MRRVAIIASVSGNGKTTLGRALVVRLGVRFVEFDALAFDHADRSHFRRRRSHPSQLARYPITRLRSTTEVERWVAGV